MVYSKRSLQVRQANLKRVNYSLKTHVKFDPKRKEIDEVIELFLGNLGITGQAVYQVQESSKKKVLNEKKEPVDVIEIYDKLEQIEQEMNNQNVEQPDEFSYDDLFQKMDQMKETEKVLMTELDNDMMNGASVADSEEPDELALGRANDLDTDFDHLEHDLMSLVIG